MAKAILEFDLSDVDDNASFMRATKSLEMALVLWEIVYNSRKKVLSKIENNLMPKDQNEKLEPEDIVDMVYEYILEMLNESDINVDNLIN
jgi:hypothetical protein